MGSSGRDRDRGGREYTQVDEWNSYEWFEDHSNVQDWEYSELSSDERHAIYDYTGLGYKEINRNQYNTPWEEMDDFEKRQIADLHNGLNKFVLNNGIIVNRACDFRIFGAGEYDDMSITDIRNYLKKSDGVLQHDGFLSFSTDPNGHGIEGKGVVIHLKVPPSTGAGAYVQHISQHSGENEFLLNNNVVIKYDYNSMYKDGHGIHINAEWLGNAEAQTISPTYNGLKLTGKGAKKKSKSKS